MQHLVATVKFNNPCHCFTSILDLPIRTEVCLPLLAPLVEVESSNVVPRGGSEKGPHGDPTLGRASLSLLAVRGGSAGVGWGGRVLTLAILPPGNPCSW